MPLCFRCQVFPGPGASGEWQPLTMSTQKTIRRNIAPVAPAASSIYLTSSDLVVRQFWVAGAAGFAYMLDPSRLQKAVQTIVDHHYPILTCRLVCGKDRPAPQRRHLLSCAELYSGSVKTRPDGSSSTAAMLASLSGSSTDLTVSCVGCYSRSRDLAHLSQNL